MSSRRELVGALSALIRLIDVSDSLASIRRGSMLANAREITKRAERGLIEPVPWTPFEERDWQAPSKTQVAAIMRQHSLTEEQVLAQFRRGDSKLFVNSRYQVIVNDCDEMVHLSIKRLDQMPIHDWRDLQRIKDELVGTECEGIELYPARSRLVDAANQYHLWVARDPTFRVPFGFNQSMISGSENATEVGAVQREIG